MIEIGTKKCKLIWKTLRNNKNYKYPLLLQTLPFWLILLLLAKIITNMIKTMLIHMLGLHIQNLILLQISKFNPLSNKVILTNHSRHSTLLKNTNKIIRMTRKGNHLMTLKIGVKILSLLMIRNELNKFKSI